MKSESEAKAAAGTPSISRTNRLRAGLWILIGVLIGALLAGVGNQWREARQRRQATARLASQYERLLPKAEQQLAGVQHALDELESGLAEANAAAAARDIKLGAYRALLRRAKAQLEQAAESLRPLSEAAGQEKWIAAENQQRRSELEQQLGQARQDLNGLESRLEAANAYWSQLVVREAEATRQAEVARIRAEAAAEVRRAEQEARQVESTSVLLASALQRLETETARARSERVARATQETPPAGPYQYAAMPPAPAPALYLPRPISYLPYSAPYYYGDYHEPFWTRTYLEPYHLRGYRSRRIGSSSFIPAAPWGGYRLPGVHRFGPYLVVD